MHTLTYMYIYAHTCTHTNTCTHAHMYINHIHTRTHMHAYTYTRAHATCMCTCMHIHTCTDRDSYTAIHIYTHIHTRICLELLIATIFLMFKEKWPMNLSRVNVQENYGLFIRSYLEILKRLKPYASSGISGFIILCSCVWMFCL